LTSNGDMREGDHVEANVRNGEIEIEVSGRVG
jgi:hypothetical protein